MISGWEGSYFDLRTPRSEHAHEGGAEILLTDDAASALRDLRLLDTECERLVFQARASTSGVVLVANNEDLEKLIGFVAAEARSEMNRRRRKELDAAFATLNAALADRSGLVTRETLITKRALIERPAAALAGRWQILEMDLWDRDALDLVGPAFIKFAPDGAGSFRFIAVNGWMDCRWVEIDGRAGVEFSWEGADEGDQVSGRGWASLQDDASLNGHIYFHLGNDSGFRATRLDEPEARRRRRSSRP